MTEPLATTNSRQINGVFFSLFRTRGAPPQRFVAPGLAAPCFVVSGPRVLRGVDGKGGGVQGGWKSIHSYPKSVPLIHYPCSSRDFPWDCSVKIYLLIYHKDPQFMSSGKYTGLDSTRTRLGTHGMVWIPSTGSWTHSPGLGSVEFLVSIVSWIQLRPSYMILLRKNQGFLGTSMFFFRTNY